MTLTAPRWRDNPRIISPAGAVRVEVARWSSARRAQVAEVAGLPADTPVVMLARAPRASGRCRDFARAARVEVEREFLTFPSPAAPGHLVEDVRESVTTYVDSILVAPPGRLYSRPLELFLALLRALPSWRLVRRLAPGRAVVGRRV